jgi:uncharacterized membrane protein
MATDRPAPLPAGAVPGESRWPMAMAVVALIGLVLLPPYAMPQMAIGAAGMMLALLALTILVDPGRIDDRSRRARRVSILLVAVLLLTTLAATAILVYDLITSAPLTNEPGPLLFAGAKVWLGNNVAFSLLYWQLDRGGPAERAVALRPYADLAFPQDQNPDIAPPGWRPVYWDYLYVSFTTANAFSPTDTMPLTHWAKVAMGTQALISFALVGLVLARAINAF